MSKHSKSKNNNIKKILIILLSIIFILSVILIIKIKYTEYKDNQKQIEVSKALEKVKIDETETNIETKRMLQVKELQKENSEIIGWIEIDGTNINYPVLQGKDNEYYLKHNYKKEAVSGGSIFLDKDYDFNIPSSNLLIYGHRHKKGLMFEDLVKYKNKEFYESHKTIKFTTPKEDSTYEIIAVFNSRVYYKSETDVFRYYYFVNATNEEEYNNFINNCKKASIYEIKETANYGEQLLTLSTCDYSTKNGRFAVVAKKINN